MTAPPAGRRVVVADRFPVSVATPEGVRYPVARLVLTRPDGGQPGGLWIWRDLRPEPELVAEGTWDRDSSTTGPTYQPWTISTPDGCYRIKPGHGCGCGSPLKRLKPWAPYIHDRRWL